MGLLYSARVKTQPFRNGWNRLSHMECAARAKAAAALSTAPGVYKLSAAVESGVALALAAALQI